MKFVRKDQKNSSREVAFEYPTTTEASSDFFGTLSMILGPISLLFKIKEIAWVGVVFSIIALLNKKKSEGGISQGISAVGVSALALISTYVNTYNDFYNKQYLQQQQLKQQAQ